MEHTGDSFADGDVTVDGNRYARCTFARCRLTYRGGEIPAFDDCDMIGCTWHFADAAERTLQMLHAIYHGLGGGGRPIVEAVFESIRTPAARTRGGFGTREIH